MTQESRLLNKPRELSKEELILATNAQQNWYPELIQTYNTSLFGMMASPIKKTIVHLFIFLCLVMIVYYFMNKNKMLSKTTKLDYSIYVVIITITIIYTTYFGQYKLNQNVMMIMALTNPGATKYDYESSPVIRDAMMRRDIRRGSSRIASSILSSSRR